MRANLTEEGAAILRAIGQKILQEYQHYQMSFWELDEEGPDFSDDENWMYEHNDRPPECGTAFCIGGWAAEMYPEQRSAYLSIEPFMMGLTGASMDEIQRLVYMHRWPMPWQNRYLGLTPYSLERAQVGAEYIEAWIQGRPSE